MIAPHTLPANTKPRRMDPRVLWVLCLALLVPLAQGWSGWHAFSHLSPSTNSTQSSKGGSERESSALHLTHCEFCLAAAAIDAIAPPAAALHFDAPSLGETLALFSPGQGPSKRPLRAYQSRAPPARFV
ncbi:DUF2946 family protein [Paucibacter sp. AS339]|uniref:DUF2946 family protein n=1 Tax=Paucibacter hankyongi TaxID=3133434 RepID=UPI0030ABFB77